MAEDIISTLPDPIICHILSFLETKQSVATSILSKRWKYLWLSVTTLYFRNTTEIDESTYFRFNDSVYYVLFSRDPALPIKTFRLEVAYLSDLQPRPSNSVSNWVNFVLQRGVEYLHLDVSIVTLPINILNCRTLVVLKLSRFLVEEGFSSVLLPSLKTLHLVYIEFSKLQDLMLIIRACPILEDLFASYLSFNSDQSLTSEEWKSFCLSNLTRADVDYTCSHFLLKAVQYARSLRLEIDEVYYIDDLIPTFHNLTQLELIYMDYYTCEFIVEVLKHCPKLQKLDIDQGDIDGNKDRKENWVDPNVVPQCLSLHLRTCNLFNFLGLQTEFLLARYILKNASVLQTMKIWTCGWPKIRRKLSSFPRASSTCKLTVYHGS